MKYVHLGRSGLKVSRLCLGNDELWAIGIGDREFCHHG